jgi:hypothetical protein
MDKSQIITLVLGSAAIGALISTAISEVGKWRERKARRAELLITESIRLAEQHMTTAFEAAKIISERGYPALIEPLIESVADYHHLLTALFNTGKLPPDYVKFAERMKKRS